MKALRELKKFWNRIRGVVDSPEELREILRTAHARRVISGYLYAIVEQIFLVADKTVEEIMIPRVDMVTVRADMTGREILKVYQKHGYTKLPVLDPTEDQVVGVLYIKELLRKLDHLDRIRARDLMRRPYYIPDSKPVLDALQDLQRRHLSIALVVNEYGNVSGMVTMEDLLEEIVGEIWEEFDREERAPIQPLGDGWYLCSGRIELDKLSQELGIPLEAEDVFTLNGFILEKLGRVPRKHEEFLIDGIRFRVEESTPQRILWVRLRPERQLAEKAS